MAERRLPELDGIRGLAILLVLVWHYVAAPGAQLPANTVGGVLYRIGLLTWSGVDLFFVLSGFLIGGILIDAKASAVFFRTFYLRRAFRILPLYVLLCVLGTLLITAAGWERFVGKPMPFFVYATFTQNFWLAHHPWDVYMVVTWSLAVEEQFYLTLPLLVRFLPAKRLPIAIGALAMASAAGRTLFYLRNGNEWGAAAYTSVFCRADALMLGALGAWVVRQPRLRTLLGQKRGILRAMIAVTGMGVLVLQYQGWTMQTRPMSTLGYSWLAMFYLSLLLLAVVASDGWWAWLMRLAPLRSLGTVAYCVYLLHETIYGVVGWLLRGQTHPRGFDPGVAATALGATLVLSLLSWRLFESRMIRIGHRFTYATDSPGAA